MSTTSNDGTDREAQLAEPAKIRCHNASALVDIPPENRADIDRAFGDLDASMRGADLHPTLTKRVSIKIDHADGTYSHFSYSRAMTMHEARQAANEEAYAATSGSQSRPWGLRRLAAWLGRLMHRG